MANFREYTSAADYCAIMDGDSMNPVFLPGDELFIRAQGFTEADAGRVMAFNVEGEFIHRLHLQARGRASVGVSGQSAV